MTADEIEALYRKYGSMVERRAQRILRNKSSAADVLQEVFVAVLKSHESFHASSSPATWLYAMTTNLCLNRMRDTKTQHAKLEQPAAEFAGLGTGTPADPESHTLLRQALSTLPHELCVVAVAYYLDQMSHEEIAEQLGVSRRTVGNRIEAFQAAARETLGAANAV